MGDKIQGINDNADLVMKLSKLCTFWIMLPTSTITEDTVNLLGTPLQGGDRIINSDNACFQDGVRRAKALKPAIKTLRRCAYL